MKVIQSKKKRKMLIMLGGIVGLVCCILCAFPCLIMGFSDKNSREPIVFWARDKNLKVKDIQGYNDEISKLYIKCALAFVAAGIMCLIHLWLGVFFVLLESTLGIYVAWKLYKDVLLRHS